jgi:dephospho-CoA kinase
LKSDIPLYLPLKIAFVGDRLSGKSSVAQKIGSKYGIMVINPQNVINEAF